MKKNQVKTDLEILKEYITMPFKTDCIYSNLTSFSNVGSVWQWTNEPLSKYFINDLDNKKVLSVTAGGDHILHAALLGSKDITGFDINIFSKYFASLKIAMIKYYNFYDFDRKSKVLFQNNLRYLKEINDVIYTLSDEEIEFFMMIEEVFEKYKDIKNYSWRLGTHLLMEYGICNTSYLLYYNADNYIKLRNNLSDCDIKFVDYSLEDVIRYDKNKYDAIFLSNILNCIEKKNLMVPVIRLLKNNLNLNGIIYDYSLNETSGLDTYLNTKDILISEDIKTEVSSENFYTGKLITYKKIK